MLIGGAEGRKGGLQPSPLMEDDKRPLNRRGRAQESQQEEEKLLRRGVRCERLFLPYSVTYELLRHQRVRRPTVSLHQLSTLPVKPRKKKRKGKRTRKSLGTGFLFGCFASLAVYQKLN